MCFTVHKLAKFSSNPGKIYFDGFIHLLRYIMDNKTLRLKYHADIKDKPLYDLLIQTHIKAEKQLMVFSDSSWKDCPNNGRSTGSYIIFY